MTYDEFLVLTNIERNKNASIDNLKSLTKEKIDIIINKFKKTGLIDDCGLTSVGYEKLEPYRVKRVIYIAAGLGSRLGKVTENLPKPLVKVNGKRMIETSIDAMLAAGINEIYIVRGYLKDKFDVLLDKYPMIHFIDNLMYDRCNNIASALLIKDLLCNAYVLDGDLIIKNPNIVTKYQYGTNYLGVYMDECDDWVLTVDKDGYVDEMVKGGKKAYFMFGFSYWTEEDGKKLAQDIPAVFNMPDGKQRYWDEVSTGIFKEHYKISVRNCEFSDIIEIDSVDDLLKIDNSYALLV